MFDNDIRHYRPAARTLNDAFGPYAKLHVPPKHYRLRGAIWAMAYGAGIGALWFALLLVRMH